MNNLAWATLVLWVIFLLDWFGLGLQFYLILQTATDGASRLMAILNYFSFFTILTNLLVAVSSSFLIFSPGSKPGKFFNQHRIISSIAVYISIVGLVYFLVLRNLWDPQGWQLVADRILHDFIPILYFIFWWIKVPGQSITWQQAWKWLVYPMTYCVYTLIRGFFTNWYPYPFLDISGLGLPKVLINVFIISLGFVFVSLLYISINQFVKQKRTHS